MPNCDLRETTDIKIKLVLNILAFSDIKDRFRSHAWTISAATGAWVNPGYSKLSQIQNSGIFRTLPYSQPSYIENVDVYKILADLEP